MDITVAKQEDREVVDFYSRLMGMWTELNNYVKILRCTCGKCECDIGAQVVKMIEEEQAHQFLIGLDDETYANV